MLAAAELALRDSVTDHTWNTDAPTSDIATRVAGQRRQLALTLGTAGSDQLHLQRFLSDASKIVLDPDWLPEWGDAVLSCKGLHGKRVPFAPLQGRFFDMKLLGLDHLVLRVVNLDEMLGFYVGVLGCTVERRQDEIGLVQLRAGHALIDLVPVDGKLGRMGGAAPGTEGRNLDHFCLRVEPFEAEAIRTHLAAHGVTAGPTERRYGAQGEGPSIYLADPEGNVVELKGPPAPAATA